MTKSVTNVAGGDRPSDEAIDAIVAALDGLRDGQLEVQLHDARVVKIMRTEKIRLYEECAPRAHDEGAR